MPRRPQRFFSLDVLRGLAALTVVFWHWQHFLLVGSRAGGGAPLTRPLGRTFELFYSVGWIAVDLFFALSGFIFFWLYAEAITERRVSRGSSSYCASHGSTRCISPRCSPSPRSRRFSCI
jgi:peptidoglycan/LPS O-acetylase OafA/YrhL